MNPEEDLAETVAVCEGIVAEEGDRANLSPVPGLPRRGVSAETRRRRGRVSPPRGTCW